MNFQRTEMSGIDYIEHLDGVDWFHAPPPPRRHKHWVQTRGLIGGHYAERCPCGAFGPRWYLLPPDKPRLRPTLLRKWINRLDKNSDGLPTA